MSLAVEWQQVRPPNQGRAVGLVRKSPLGHACYPYRWAETEVDEFRVRVVDHLQPDLSGVFTRIAQRLLAMAAGIWDNWTTGMASKRSLIAFDH